MYLPSAKPLAKNTLDYHVMVVVKLNQNWAIPENIHIPPMDDIGNPAENA